MTVKNEMERMGKEAVVDHFTAVWRHQKQERTCWDNRSLGPTPRTPKYEAEILPTRSRCPATVIKNVCLFLYFQGNL